MNLNAAKKILSGIGAAAILYPEDAEAMNVGPLAKGWANLPNKFSSLFDKKVRAEISDNAAKASYAGFSKDINNIDMAELQYVLKHDELFSQYPHLRKAQVQLMPDTKSSSYTDIDGLDFIAIGNRGTNYTKDLKGKLLHEIQHAIQEKEGWARGGSPNDPTTTDIREKLTREAFNKLRPTERQKGVPVLDTWNASKAYANSPDAQRLDVYPRLAGEIESRDTVARQGLTAEQRTRKLPFSSENINPQDAIIRYGTAGAMGATALAGNNAYASQWKNFKSDEEGLQDSYNPLDMAIAAATGGATLTLKAAAAALDPIIDTVSRQIFGE